MSAPRDNRQAVVGAWVRETFGVRVANDLSERVARVLEEAIELAQAEGLPPEDISSLISHVYSKEPGRPEQEVGGLSVTLLAYCDAVGYSADQLEELEVDRILSKPRAHFRDRQDAKAAAGIARKSA